MKRLLALAALAATAASPAYATLDLSNKATHDMSCSDGVCTATADQAVLNVDDLASMLADGDVRVETEGVAAQDIVVVSPLSWSSAHALTLHSSDAVYIRDRISVLGMSKLDLDVAGGPFLEKQGAIKFANTRSKLVIDGTKYKLVHTIADMAAAITARPKGNFALADDYDAHNDGQYRAVPIQGEFRGTFDGLGNRIANFSLWNTADGNSGLFEAVVGRGTIRNLGIKNVNILAEDGFNNVYGGLVAYLDGTLEHCYADGGIVRTDFLGTGGGLVGQSYGNIIESWADVDVEGAQGGSFGGLAGNAHGHVVDSYALGKVDAGDNTDVGGLVGYSFGHVRNAYATAKVIGGQNARVGGFEGTSQIAVHRAYWDTETSGTSVGIASGAHTENTVGMGTAGLQANLPRGFSPAVWGQDPDINNGLPYLLRNPPR
ncbi:MAG TPA: GLUG motif-containing protein [Rhizomicrobium sp.]|nr:GLUG motif-containing protein [Rhizomicrobium sp.]